MTRPVLVKEEVIDFGLTKINSRVARDITIYNPSDLPVYYQFFIGPDEFANISAIQKIASQPYL